MYLLKCTSVCLIHLVAIIKDISIFHKSWQERNRCQITKENENFTKRPKNEVDNEIPT